MGRARNCKKWPAKSSTATILDFERGRTVLIAMAGLPGTGKSYVANALAARLSALPGGKPAVVLDKDRLRASIFPPQEIEYSSAQDNFCMDLLYQAAGYLLAKGRIVILDGRTYARQAQVSALRDFARRSGADLKVIECVCAEEVACQRLRKDIADGSHPAANRGPEMYRQLKALSEPLDLPHQVVDTVQALETCLAACLQYLFPSPEIAHD